MMPSVPYEGVHVTHRTDRDSIDRMSDPLHTVNATVTWKATLQNIGQAFNCKAGVDNPVAVWTSFVPVVTDSKLYTALACTELFYYSTTRTHSAVSRPHPIGQRRWKRGWSKVVYCRQCFNTVGRAPGRRCLPVGLSR